MIRRNGKSALAARVAVVILLPVLALAQGDKIADAEKIRAKADMLSSGSVTVSVELKEGARIRAGSLMCRMSISPL